MKRLGIVAAAMLVVVPAFAGVVEDSGIRGGIVVQIGCKDVKSLANLLVNNRVLVHWLDVDAKRIEEVRDSLRSDRLYGRISAAVFDGENLPYTDNLINLMVIEDPQCRITQEEMMRVLVPGGMVVVGGKKTTKPVPSNIDEWTHFLHGADNNAVANDTVVAAPRTIQWVSNPRWGRSHEEAASVSALVSANGRVFAIMDEAPNISIRFMPDWKLVARDAFNGMLLWKRDIPAWSDHLRHFRAGPVHLPRRLVAVGNRVYVTLGLDAPVSILDASTGETLKVLKGTERTEEIAVDDGVVYLAVGTSEVYRRGGGLHERGEPKAADFRYIVAIDPGSGRQVWKKDFTGTDFLLPMSMTVRNGSVFYQDINGVGRLDARTGTEIWEKKRRTVARRMSFSSPTVVATDEVLLVADRIPKVDSREPQQMAA
ncbi:MAG: PQQ-binding-like beta-propeller repeat protein, partial [Phycisphaerales bacterium]